MTQSATFDQSAEQQFGEAKPAFGSAASGGSLALRVDFHTKRYEVDWLGQKRFGFILPAPAV